MERVAGELPEGTLLLDRYEVIDRIASGGMATIYRAMDDRLDRVVCVKLLRLVVKGTGSGGGAGSVYRATYSHFMQEALALSKLQHPNTLRIYDFGYLAPASPDESGAPFQISEYLDGGNLASHIRRRGALTADETCAIFDCISGAVAEGHEHAIVHRDIKPSNILFARVGDVLMPKLADFGIASIRDKVESEFMILERLEMSLEERLKGSRYRGKKDDLLALDMRDRIFRVLDYMIPVSSAIEYAHLVRDICHRDIKPANILLQLPDPNLRAPRSRCGSRTSTSPSCATKT